MKMDDKPNKTWEVIENFKSIPCVTKKTKNRTTVLPDDMWQVL